MPKALFYFSGSYLTKSGSEPAVEDTSFDTVVKSESGSKYETAVWSGKTEDKKNLLEAIGKTLNKFEITDVDKTKDMDIHVSYYQPELPVMKLSYLKFKDKTGKSHSILISADKEEVKWTTLSRQIF